MKTKYWTPLVLFMISFAIRADDSPEPSEIKWLRDTPASLFDVGLLKLNLQLQDFRFSDNSEMRPRASYNYDRNVIEVHVSPFELKPDRTVDAAKSKCEEGVNKLRKTLEGHYLPSKDPRLTIISIMFEPTRTFGSRGAQISMPEEIARYLVNNVELVVSISHKSGTTRCTGRLGSMKISVE